nr:mesothelin-like protein [Oncorhynchus nerka]
MDITTFKGLESTVIPSLTVSEVKGLLGANVDDLKTFENDTVVHAWLIAQPQSDLDLLRLGLTGGKETSTAVVPTAVVPLNTTNTTLAHNAVTAKPLPITTTQNGVGNGGAHPEKDLGALSLCLALVTVILQMM